MAVDLVTLDPVDHLVVPLVQVVMPGLLEAQAWGPVTPDLVDHLLVPLVQAVMLDLCLNKVTKEQTAHLRKILTLKEQKKVQLE